MGATLARRSLGRRLEQARRVAGKTREGVALSGLASITKLWRIETGQSRIKVGDVLALCQLYEVDAKTTVALSNMAKRTDDHGWWEDYSAIPDWFGLYVDLESMAAEVQVWDPELVHGLLQTPNYVRALFAANRPDLASSAVDQIIRSRAERQQALHREDPEPLRLTAVFGAAVLHRQVGSEDVMAEQIQHMRDLSALEHVDIRVLPWEAGPHPAMHTGAFTILSCLGDDPDVVYREGHTGAQYMEMPAELEAYRGIFTKIRDQSIPIREYAP